jgi:hypothetical protein
MKLYSMLIGSVLAGVFGLQAQIPASHVAESKQFYTMIKNNVVAMADKMPEENYSFKASEDIRTFGQLIAHVADTQARICSVVTGSPKSVGAGSKTSKADLVAALKESVDICDAAWEAMGEHASEEVNLGFIKGSKLAALEFNTMHSDEEYGYMAVYMRIKGIVPPSSAGRGGRGGR